MPNTEKQMTAMTTLRSKLFTEAEDIKEDAKTDQYSRGYRNALLWICNDIDSQMLATERQQLIDFGADCIDKSKKSDLFETKNIAKQNYFNTFKTQ
jgi:hypothetical protein